MTLRIEDYAMIGDRVTSALVGLDGSIDWLCLPHFDSQACFAALLGNDSNGNWRLCPREAPLRTTRRYRGDTLILETTFETAAGSVTLTDFLAAGQPTPTLVRLIHGVSGKVEMQADLAFRFDYGVSIPWVTRLDDDAGLCAIAGPNMVVLRTAVKLRGEDMRTRGRFTVAAGETASFVLTYGKSHCPILPAVDPAAALAATIADWDGFIGRCTYAGRYKQAVHRSLLTLRALTYAPTGGIVAAPTTSLPEQLGGGRNWDYRFCWLRDASLTLFALMGAGYQEEAASWRDWLHRSIAGSAAQIQIMYGLHGERVARRARAALAARLRGQRAGAHRQCGQRPGAAGRLWRGAGLPAPGPTARPARRTAWLGLAAQYRRPPGHHLGQAGRGHVGDPRRQPAFHLQQGDGLGGNGQE